MKIFICLLMGCVLFYGHIHAEEINKESLMLEELNTYEPGVLTVDQFRTKWDFTGDNNLGIVNLFCADEIITYELGRISVPQGISNKDSFSAATIKGLEFLEYGIEQGGDVNGATSNASMITVVATIKFNRTDNKMISLDRN
ncbi:MAG: hypothetical protein V1747_04640 [Candidatus Omnitrophota bacterium]